MPDPMPDNGTTEPTPIKVGTERRIFVGEDKQAFKRWLASFVDANSNAPIEGYVLDLSGGTLWAVLDLSDISQEVYDNIILRAVERDDACASEAFIRLTRNCDPVTALNRVTYSFDVIKWPALAATCSLFVGSAEQPTSVNAGLLRALQKLKSNGDRRQQFRAVVKKAVAQATSQLRCHFDLIQQAHAEEWPQWAVECLPSLFIPLSALPNGEMRALVWHYLVACFPANEYQVHRTLCNGAVDEVSLSAGTVKEIRRVVDTFERYRLTNPFPSEESTIGVVVASRIETGLDSSNAPICNEIKEMVQQLDPKRDIKTAVEPAMNGLPTWKPKVVKLAEHDRWPRGAIVALKSIPALPARNYS